MPPKKIQIKAINALTEKELLDKNKIKQREEEYKQRLAEYIKREKKLNKRERELEERINKFEEVLEEREIACKEIDRRNKQIKMFLDMADNIFGN